eukprot:GHVN01103396.1.p1 GENE.GHVN01103396.1~~GHVN01103396.1.p1  ORF type:complete len:386 (-),score=29.18 GHVN01103396.1:761-1918(-)
MGSYSEETNQRLELNEVMGKLTLTDRPVPKPQDDGFILKTHYSGICHSDLHMWQNKIKISDELVLGMEAFVPDFAYPRVLGHEMSGEIHALGANYTGDRQVGDRVAVYPWLGCEQCDMCSGNTSNMCAANVASSLGIGKEGGFQSYVSVPDVKHAVVVPDDVGMDVACLFGCSALTSYNAVCKVRGSIEAARKTSGAGKLLIIGAGGLGLWVLQWARALLPKDTVLYVADVTEDKLELAKQQGASETILWKIGAPDDELIAKTKEVTRGGFDGCVDLVGIPSTVNKAFQCAQKQACIAVVGITGGLASIPIFALAINAVTVAGIYTGTREQMKEMMSAYTKYQVEAPPISVVAPREGNAALQQLREGKVQGRMVIQFNKPSNTQT